MPDDERFVVAEVLDGLPQPLSDRVAEERDVTHAVRVRGRAHVCASDRARSRSSNFFTLPVDVFGNSPNSISLGALKPGSVSRENAISSSDVNSAPGRSVT